MRGYIKDRIYYKYEKESGKLRIGNGSWSINMAEITPDSVDKVVCITEYALYRIDMMKAFEYGFMRIFKGEDKLVVPIRYWTITFKKGAEADERERKATSRDTGTSRDASGDTRTTGGSIRQDI